MNGTAIRPAAKKYRFAALELACLISAPSGSASAEAWDFRHLRRVAVRFSAWF